MNKRFARYFATVIIILSAPITLYYLSLGSFSRGIIYETSAASNGDFGAVTFVSSLPSSSNKQTVVNESSKLGVGWVREEYTYSDDIDFAPYDAAYAKIKAANLNILGLLTYQEGRSHAQWKNYVRAIVNHFSGVTSWEIMNEADNYLSPADYVVYLKEANEIIKAKNASAKVILSGITARVESPNFWNGVKSAGGWDYLDAIGLHIFHDGDPSQDSYNNGSLGEEVQHAIDNADGKKIWVTEFGWDSNAWGTDNQANWLSSGLGTIHCYSEVEKIFVFRMFDKGNGFGLLTSSFSEKPSFEAVKNKISSIIGQESCGGDTDNTVDNYEPSEPTITPVPITVDRETSTIRLDKLENLSNGQNNYRIVVLVKDVDGNIVTSIKPRIIIEGIPTDLTDFSLTGNEWFGYVTSKAGGGCTANISAGGQSLGSLSMTFVGVTAPAKTPTISPTSQAPLIEANKETKKIAWPLISAYVLGSAAIIGLFTFLYFKRRSKLVKRGV